jgi:hypothetical protein
MIFTELDWLKKCIQFRIQTLNESKSALLFEQHPAASIDEEDLSEYALLIRRLKLNSEERLLLILALSVHLDPRILLPLVSSTQLHLHARVRKTDNEISLLPTAETAFFLIAGKDFRQAILLHSYFDTAHSFYKESMLQLGDVVSGASRFDGVLTVTSHYRDLLLYNQHRPPRFSTEFPAHLLTTDLDWDDLVLMPYTADLLNEVKMRVRSVHDLRKLETKSGLLARHVPPGQRVLLYGASGQGKTLTAALIGKMLNRPVYRVDLTGIVSKWVGETEKNLRALFDTAERKDWVLFIDEAEGVVGKRVDQSQSAGAQAHYINQGITYVLQRIEKFDGIVLFATNLSQNIDEAFKRRFDAHIYYKALDSDSLVTFFNRNWPNSLNLNATINLKSLLADNYLSPAALLKVILRVSMLTMDRGQATVPIDVFKKCLMDEALLYKS